MQSPSVDTLLFDPSWVRPLSSAQSLDGLIPTSLEITVRDQAYSSVPESCLALDLNQH